MAAGSDAPQPPEIQSVDAIEGSNAWRVLVLLSPGDEMGLVGELGSEFARSQKGELILACLVPAGDSDREAHGRETLEKAFTRAADDEITVHHAILIPVKDNQILDPIRRLVASGSIDLILMRSDRKAAELLKKPGCDIGILRGKREQLDQEPAATLIDSILVPTTGGPNTGRAFELLLPLVDQHKITALYVAPEHLGGRERVHGYSILRQTLSASDAAEGVRRKVTMAPSVTRGIVEEAAEDYDLVVVGANENPLDRVMFGDIVAAVVRESRKPVMIFRRHRRVGSGLLGRIDWQLRRLMPHLNKEARDETYSRIRQNSRPGINFYVLIALSAAIASFGLLQNSPAVVIGAMLVAPLMSPIVGLGLSMVLGELHFLQMASRSVGRGVLLALVVSAIVGTIQIGQPLPNEVLARTAPNLLDLGVALFSGLAGAYALCYSQAAGALPGVAIAAALVPPLATVGIAAVTGNYDRSLGALLLFGTNLITIASASALTFFILGFRPTPSEKEERLIQARTVRLAVALLVINAVILGIATYGLFQENKLTADVEGAIERSLPLVAGGEARVEGIPEIGRREGNGEIIELDLVIRAPRDFSAEEGDALQAAIKRDLAARGVEFGDLALDLTVVKVNRYGPPADPETAAEDG